MTTATTSAGAQDKALSNKPVARPAVSFENVAKRYGDSPAKAVDGVSFEVQEGELLVLLGPSGCGKTTSLRLIAGLEQPDAGTISVGGRLVNSPDEGVSVPAEKRNIGMVFQSYAIWPHMSVLENVAYPLRARRVPRRLVRPRVEHALEVVGLGGMAERSSTKLSGGQQQRVALARALVFEPTLLLLDEPLSNLDAKLRSRMRLELKEVQRKTGVAAVFVTHDQAESMALADRIVVMNEGRIEQVGTPTEIYECPKTRFVAEFIGSSNLFAGELVGGEAAGSLVRVRLRDNGRELLGQAAGGASMDVAGQPVYVVIRPERLSLVRRPDQARESTRGLAPNVWKCEVRVATYYGERRDYQVVISDDVLAGYVLSVSSPPETVLAVGDTAYVTCCPTDLVVALGSK